MDGEEGQAPAPRGTFEFNRPTLIGLLYLGTYFTGISAFVGIVLAYVWRKDAAEWEASHYLYLIRTFWIGLLVGVIGFALLGSILYLISDHHGSNGPATLVAVLAVILATPVLLGDAIWIGARCVVSIVNAMQKHPLPKPGTWWV